MKYIKKNLSIIEITGLQINWNTEVCKPEKSNLKVEENEEEFKFKSKEIGISLLTVVFKKN